MQLIANGLDAGAVLLARVVSQSTEAVGHGALVAVVVLVAAATPSPRPQAVHLLEVHP